MKRSTKIAAMIGAAVVAGGIGGGAAFAAGGTGDPVTTARPAPQGFYACVAGGNKVSNVYPSGDWHQKNGQDYCPAGSQLYAFPSQEQLDAALAGKAAAPITASGSTHVTDWAENGSPSWAVDNFTRNADVKQGARVDAAKCGAGATECYFYSGTLTDNGTFLANAGAPTPAGNDGSATISNVVSGAMSGVAKVEFYADQAPTVDLPVSQDGRAPSGPLGSTTNWVEAMFPAGTHFGAPHLTGYDWSYTSDCEMWTEHYVESTGQPETQTGNITGNACAAQ
ncbi:MAG TPA: hypothetical protein VHC49_06485 [Mycobacteriales bacterium]|nr:hypothetical protein [Mycobacteriales bacterium]